jgi:hypothetical protein
MSSPYDNLRDLVDDEDSSGQSARSKQARQRRESRRGDGKILGFSAGQRAFLSVMLFVAVVIIGMALLAATGRLSF